MKKPSGRKVVLLLSLAIVIAGGLIFASINPAETSPTCMPDYIKEHGSDACVEKATSSEASIKVLEADN
jgi:hypothetical protein